MAVCECCGREMTEADGCYFSYVTIGRKVFPRIKVGDPEGLDFGWLSPGERCHDCGAKFGFYHHPGCDMDTCPNCGGQIAFCDCDVTTLLTGKQ